MMIRPSEPRTLFAVLPRLLFGGLIAVLAGLCITPTPAADTAKTKPSPLPKPAVTAPYKAAIVIDATSGAVLFEHAADRISPPASMTKLMTFLLVHDAIERGQLRLDSRIRITAASAGSTPSCSTQPTTVPTRSPSQSAAQSRVLAK